MRIEPVSGGGSFDFFGFYEVNAMYAHRLALLCLVIASSLSAFGEDAKVVVVFQHADRIPEGIRDVMKREAEALLMPAEYIIHWQDAQGATTEVDGELILVDLRGPCAPPPRSDPAGTIVQLGSTAVSDRKILPFSWVDCTALARVIETSGAALRKQQRDLLYGRALGRILAHEMYHILARTMSHTETGVAKARFDLTDVLDEHAALEGIPPGVSRSIPIE